MKKMIVTTMRIDTLTDALKAQMWDLYQSTYDFVDEKQFYADLKTKNHVFVGFDKKTHAFKGFSTVNLYTTEFENKKVGVMFSGDTIIHPDYWGTKALHKEFITFAYLWKVKNLGTPLYWNLIASGNRTYLAMARNCATYYPRYDQSTPSWEKGFIDFIGAKQFGPRFDLETGVIKVDKPEAVLKSHLAPFTGQVKTIPEISFFIEKNKGYEKGDELSCIARFDFKFITNFLGILIKKNMPKPILFPEFIPVRLISVSLTIAASFGL